MAAFRDYFGEQPRKRKRGRPRKKKKRKRGRKKQHEVVDLSKPAQQSQMVIDVSADDGDKAKLDAKLAGLIAKEKRTMNTIQKRVNWAVSPWKEQLARLKKSWINKNDLFKDGMTFNNFCERNGVSYSVMRRYLKNPTKKKRGRKTLLSEDVMLHLCEGMLLHVCQIKYACILVVHT